MAAVSELLLFIAPKMFAVFAVGFYPESQHLFGCSPALDNTIFLWYRPWTPMSSHQLRSCAKRSGSPCHGTTSHTWRTVIDFLCPHPPKWTTESQTDCACSILWSRQLTVPCPVQKQGLQTDQLLQHETDQILAFSPFPVASTMPPSQALRSCDKSCCRQISSSFSYNMEKWVKKYIITHSSVNSL